MKKLLLCLLWSNFVFAAPLPTKRPIITLNEKTIIINSFIDGALAEKVAKRIAEQQTSSEIIIFIDSEGGNQVNSMEIIEVIESSKVPIICVAKLAASGAQSIFQSCTQRLGSQFYSGMQHKAYIPKNRKEKVIQDLIKENGYSKEEAEQLFQNGMQPIIDLDKKRLAKEAKRQKLTLEQFAAKFTPEYYWTIETGLKENNLDGEVKLLCSLELLQTKSCPLYKGEK